MHNITLVQALLLGFWYYFIYSGCWFFGSVGYATLWRPLTGGFVVGIILGNPLQGLLIGASIQLIYIGFTAIGNAVPQDPALAGIVATALAISADMEVGTACALAVPVALFGSVMYPIRLTVSSFFANKAAKEGRKANRKGIIFWNVIAPQVVWCIFCMIPVVLATYFGDSAVQAALKYIPEWAMNGFNVVGGILPALGIAMTLVAIGNIKVMPFFFLGFVLTKYLGFSSIVIAIIFGCVAIVMVTTMKDDNREDFGVEAEEERHTVLDKKTVFKTWLDWLFFAESGLSYTRLQGIGFMQAMSLPLSKMYTEDKDELGQEIVKYDVFFNTEPDFGTSVLGIILAMEEERYLQKGSENRISAEEINSVKTGLMGPFAGIGDTLMQITLMPILVSFTTELALKGFIGAPVLLIILGAGIIIPVSYLFFKGGYTFGKGAINKILGGGLMDKILLAAGIIGCSVLGCMTAGYVTANCGLVFQLMAASGDAEAVMLNVQTDIFDTLLQGILPLGVVLGTYGMLKKGMKNLLALVILFVLGFVLGAIGILI